MTLNLRWSAVIKAFRLKEISSEQKWNLFAEQEKLDPTDTAKNNRYRCQALIATKEQFEQIYNQFKVKESGLSISVK